MINDINTAMIKPCEATNFLVGNGCHLENRSTALYCRLAQANDERMAAQEQKLRRYAKENDYEVCDLYRDNGKSGVTLDRQGLRALLAKIQCGNVKRVLVSNLTRLTRDSLLMHELIDMFSEYGVELISMNDGGLVDFAEFKLFKDVLLSMQEAM